MRILLIEGLHLGSRHRHERLVGQLTGLGHTVAIYERGDKQVDELLADATTAAEGHELVMGVEAGGRVAHVVAARAKRPAVLINPAFVVDKYHQTLGKEAQAEELIVYGSAEQTDPVRWCKFSRMPRGIVYDHASEDFVEPSIGMIGFVHTRRIREGSARMVEDSFLEHMIKSVMAWM